MDTKRKLIGLIKDHAVLYNTNHSAYKDTATRSEAWDQIAADMDMTAHDCKVEWSKLRNSYVNALRRRVSVHHRDGRVLPPWVYEPELGFLKPFMNGRGFDATPYTVLLPDHTLDFDNDVTSETIEEFPLELTENKRKSKHRTPKVELEDASYEILEPDTERISLKSQDIINVMDESDLFFLGLSQTFKKLPRIEQCKLKMDIFKILNEAEMRQIKGSRKRSKRSSSSSE